MSFIGNKKPCILYQCKLDVTKMEQYKLEYNNRSKKVPVYSATHGVEGLFHVIDKFNKAAARLNIPAADRWDQWEDVLDTTAESKWTAQVTNIGAGQRNNNRLLREQLNFLHAYAGSENPRDVLFAYIDKDHGPCRKGPSVGNMEHANRVQALIRYGNRLRGTVPAKDPANEKLSVFNTFPDDWKRDYSKSSHVLANETISQLVDYMEICKEDADEHYRKGGKNRKRKYDDDDDTERIRGGNGKGKNGRSKYKGGKRTQPKKCVHDNGGEFIGEAFQQMLEKASIKDVPTTSRAPTANSICERMHQTVGNILRSLLHGHPPTGVQEANAIIDSALATAMHATRCAASRSLNYSTPGSIAFNRDMFLNVPFIADLQTIRNKRQQIIDENLRRQNAKRRQYDYQPGDQVWIKEVDPTKLGPRGHGPYNITRIHTNGTVTLQRRPHVTERINLRRIYPHRVAQQLV